MTEVLSRVRELRDEIRRLDAERAAFRRRRTRLIGELLAAGVSVRRVADISGVSKSEIHRLRAGIIDQAEVA